MEKKVIINQISPVTLVKAEVPAHAGYRHEVHRVQLRCREKCVVYLESEYQGNGVCIRSYTGFSLKVWANGITVHWWWDEWVACSIRKSRGRMDRLPGEVTKVLQIRTGWKGTLHLICSIYLGYDTQALFVVKFFVMGSLSPSHTHTYIILSHRFT